MNFIHAHLDRKLILISAPAGYGKTSLLIDFTHDTDLPVCWYTLDAYDRDPRIFLEHLIFAIALRFPAFGERSRAFLRKMSDPGHNLYPMVATLVQEIYDTIPEYFVLIVDDHHTVEDCEPINKFLDLLVTYVDENCHLILASRALPALPNLPTLTQSGPQPPCYLVRPESPTAKAFWLRIDTLGAPSGPNGSLIVRLRDVTGQVDSTRGRRAFTQMIQHKMRTPLINVLAGSEYLADAAPELPVDEIAELAGLAIRGARSFHQSVEDILSYLDAPGRARLGEEFHLSELQPVVAEIGSGLEIERATVFCPEDVADASLLLSKRAMELVLWELLENAKKFHPTQDPTVGILVSRASSREISLQVRDDGLTVSPEHLGKFWTPFYQGEKDFTGEVPGMGLGLSTVAMLVWEVGGTCCAYNREDGPGIVIDLTLPSNEETGASNRPSLAT